MNIALLPSSEQVLAVAVAFALTALIGAERELRHKDAGMRTHVLVGLGSCLFTLVSIGGMPADLTGNMRWDASRIAAQIVSGIGFIGAGVIWFNRDAIRGLTTASAIWVAAAIGMSCGAQMYGVAGTVVLAYFILVLAMSPIFHKISQRNGQILEIAYADGQGILRALLIEISKRGYESQILGTRQLNRHDHRQVVVNIRLIGSHKVDNLMEWLSEYDGVDEVKIVTSVD